MARREQAEQVAEEATGVLDQLLDAIELRKERTAVHCVKRLIALGGEFDRLVAAAQEAAA